MLLSMENISKVFNGRTILDNVSLTIEERDRIALVGANGCGKSTLLKIITGQEEYESQPEPNVPSLVLKKGISVGFLQQDTGLDRHSEIYAEMLSVFAETFKIKDRLTFLENQMSLTEIHSDDKRFREISAEYDRLTAEFDAREGYMVDVKIKTVLNGMGFHPESYGQIISTLSGGEKTRLAMAKLLLESPDLLILDEPTNHLDFNMIMWLEDYLTEYKGAMLIVSHDRYFLDKLCSCVCNIEGTRLRRWKGNYSRFTLLKEADDERRLKEYEAQQQEIAKLQDFVSRNIVRATTSAMAKSRVKTLERMELLEKPSVHEKKARIRFEYDYEPPEDVLDVKNLTVAAGDKILAENISFHVRRGDKIGIVGGNGTGKSTLLKIIQKKLPSKGTVQWNRNIRISYFDQENSQLDFNKTVIDEIHDRRQGMTDCQIRSLLGQVLLTGENVFKKVGVISGGERAKLCFAIMMLERGNVLILDEPTNHLDIDAREVLEEALSSYTGTVLLVSHDRYLLNKVCGRIFELSGGCAEEFDCGFDEYLSRRKARADEEARTADSEKSRMEQQAAAQKKESSYRNKEQRARDAKRRTRIKELEDLINGLEVQMSKTQQEMLSPNVTADYRLMNETCARYDELKRQSEIYSDEWLELCQEDEND